MADLGNSKRAQVLVDGAPILEADAAQVSSSANVIAAPAIVNGTVYIVGNLAGECTVNVARAGRSGSLAVTVTNDPLVITLGTPEPK